MLCTLHLRSALCRRLRGGAALLPVLRAPACCLLSSLPAGSRCGYPACTGTVGEPFFPRRADGSILWDKIEADWDPDGMSMLVR